ncbi:MAG: universal stress protein [Burkholderiaceae bacterium]
MSYKSILVHVDDALNAARRYEMAFQTAERENAHVLGAAMTGISRHIYQPPLIDGTDAGMVDYMITMGDLAREQAAKSLDAFKDMARARGISFEARLVEDEPYAGLALLSRSCDLVVLSQTNRDDPACLPIADLPEYVALGSARPVLVVPYAGSFAQAGSRILVAWDGSTYATRATSCALPFLKRALEVDIAVVNPASKPDLLKERPGEDIREYLARHGVEARVSILEAWQGVGNALLLAANEKRSDMIVMGCYGHARFHEMMLGGVTRTILKKVGIPVLMSH